MEYLKRLRDDWGTKLQVSEKYEMYHEDFISMLFDFQSI